MLVATVGIEPGTLSVVRQYSNNILTATSCLILEEEESKGRSGKLCLTLLGPLNKEGRNGWDM
jgi:hypothetical protein